MASEDSGLEASNEDRRETGEPEDPLPAKEILERRKLSLEIDRLRNEKERAGRPTTWEVFKTAVPWISIFLSALVFMDQYRDQLKEQRADRLAAATDNYFGDHPALGIVQLLQYAGRDEDAEGEAEKVLASGLRPENTTEEDRRRNRWAIQGLARLPSDSGQASAIASLCPHVLQWASQLDAKLLAKPAAGVDVAKLHDEINDSAHVICATREVSPDACNARLSPQAAATFDSFIDPDLLDCGAVRPVNR